LKKLLFIELALLVLGSLTGCGARRRAVMATATAQALTATAMAQPPVATAPAVSATRPTGAILFQDDFQDGQPDGWQITAAWYVQQEGNVYYFGSSGQGGAWVPGGGSWSDYEFQSTVRVTAGGVILSYRLTQEGRYLLHLREDGLYLTKEYPKGNYTTLTQTAAPSLNAWHQVSVAGYGGHLQVYVDRMLQLDYTDPSPLLQGTIAVATLEGSQAAVDDVLVTRLMTALPTPAPMALPPTVAPPATPLPEEAGLPLEEVPPPEEVAPPPPPPVAGLPVIDYFRSEPSERAGCYYLHWELHDASVAYLNDVGVVAPGSEEVCPDESGVYVYTLRAENDVGDVEETITFEAGGEVGQPDLEIGDVSVWVPMPTEPGTVAIEIPVNNVGSGPAGAFTVRWYPHQASVELGCSLDIMGLDAGVGQILTCPPYPYAGHGEMHWRAIVDEDNEIQNDPKGNNEARGTVRIEVGEGQQPQPDLVITGAHFEQGGQTVAQVVAGQPFNAVFQVANQGSAPTGPFTIVWHFHEATGLKNCCSRDYPDGLDAGAWGGGTFPNLVTTAQPGESPTWVEVDAGDRVDEGEEGEGNNRLDLRFTVAGAEPASQADLVIRNLSIEPNPVLLGGIGVFTVSFDVVNEGDAQAAPSTAHWEIVADTRWNFDCPVSALSPGASAQCENAFVGLPSEAGNYGTKAIADSGNVVQEGPEGEGNNEASETLQVRP
jgi:hypothetical protein